MNNRVAAIVLKEVGHILADRQTLIIVVLIPVFQLLLFGYAIDTVADHLPTVVFDGAQDPESRALVAALQNSGFFDVTGTAASYEEAVAAIDAGTAQVAMIVSPTFGRDLLRGRTAQAQILVDGSDPSVAQAASFAAEAVGRTYTLRVANAQAERLGLGRPALPVEIRTTLLYNPGMLSVAFIIPGVIGIILQQYALTLTAQAITRERDMGTLEQLNVTPIRTWELMVGKCVPYAVIALVCEVLTLILARIVFGVQIAGSVGLLLAFSLLFVLGSLCVGLLISVISRTELQARQLSNLFLLPAVLLTGFIFPRESMPELVQQISLLIPLTYFLQMLRGIILKDVGLDVLWPQAVPLVVYGLLAFAGSVRWFKKWSD